MAPFIQRMGLSFMCVLDAGHSGDHSAGMAQWPQAPHAAAAPSISWTTEIGTTPAAPGVTKEVEAAVDELVCRQSEWAQFGSEHRLKNRDAARAALLDAIEKYGEVRYTQGIAYMWVKEAKVD